jgi:hypothetical protein
LLINIPYMETLNNNLNLDCKPFNYFMF